MVEGALRASSSCSLAGSICHAVDEPPVIRSGKRRTQSEIIFYYREELYTPLSPSAAAGKAVRPSVDTRVPNDQQPPVASQALPPVLPVESAPKPPATESTEQPTPLLSVFERVWNAAYDSLETDNAELVMSYVKTST
ncbi:hypothetical protein N657DRAFT_650830 [Parathielavia appendiculata]|uniref:Uncharacterized protein n=1 Tax=Parathielavia appendiculata TaxID=2587402 RepID=A0AAN6TRA8_9PEZI|nr:hypothetical protein N657DRAFT_650830 [Parathielavia appendiculata]